MAAAAFASAPGCSLLRRSESENEIATAAVTAKTNCALPPRRLELLDFDWRFKPMPPITMENCVTLEHWFWTQETSEHGEDFSRADLSVASPEWQTVNPDQMNVSFTGYAWFRTVLPDISGPGRAVSFTHVEDICEVHLNGQTLDALHGWWSASFTVNLDRAWKVGGPNVLAVRVRNDGRPGGIRGAVQLGKVAATESCFSPGCDDRAWRQVQLPHDYIVEGQYRAKADTDHGALPVYPAWYRRKFSLDTVDRDKCVWLYFEGVFRDARVYVNGQFISRHPGGYTSFHVDLTDAVRFDAENLLAIYVDPTNYEGWWYEGGGIYRHVWLNIADQVHVAPWGVHVTSEVADVTGIPSAKLCIETLVANRTNAHQNCTVTSTVLAPDGQVVAKVQDELRVAPSSPPPGQREKILAADDVNQPSLLHSGTRLVQTANLASAKLWSLEERNRYTVLTEISWRDKIVDRHTQKFGIRTLRFDADQGFYLNEKPVKINGACVHQDFAGVGIGLTDSLWYYRMKRLQEFGCNAIRCCHNPMPAMYEACDELGLLVMAENRHPGSSVAGKFMPGQSFENTWHVESMILRDRNHPSIIIWSMWNEEITIQNTPLARQLMTALRQAVHKHDQTRPVTCANNGRAQSGAWLGGVAEAEDLLGVNYNYGNYDILHREFPDKMIFGSEIGSKMECRGIYQTDPTTAHLSSYVAPDDSWAPLASRPFVAGGFYWAGFDYRGETTPFHWPEVTSNFGFLDLCGFPKDAAYYWKAWWQRDVPLVHIFPHWNWPGKEGQNVPVWCFSNCDEVELFLNGRSLGKQAMPEFGHLQWDHVAYEPGRLEARGYKNGQPVGTKTLETTGAPAGLRLTPDRAQLLADGQDTVPVMVAVVDAQGRVVPDASNKIYFKISGAGVNAGVGNGDPSCHEPDQSGSRSAFNGYCLLLVRAARTGGMIQVVAQSPGLADASVRLKVASA
jgi:beta-galactosidase